MKQFAMFLLLYPVFLLQAALSPWCPDLLMLTIVALAVARVRGTSSSGARFLAAGLGCFAGFMLDLLTPGAFGLNMLVYAAVGYGTAEVVGFTYHADWLTLPVVLAGMGLRFLGGALTPAGTPAWLPFLVSAGLTLLLALPWQSGIRRLYRLP